MVGWGVGAVDGVCVGLVVGTGVGAVGFVVGTGVGAVGLGVGAADGDGVGMVTCKIQQFGSITYAFLEGPMSTL